MSQKPRLVFTAINRHNASCGKPPFIKDEGQAYFGYYLNRHGEQMLLQYNHASRQLTVWHGDCNWEHPFVMDVPNAAPFDIVMDGLRWMLAKWTLNEDEIAWMRTCLHTIAERYS